ncbi:MAG: acetate--CoA ligase family protein [Salinarchaeum sp.]
MLNLTTLFAPGRVAVIGATDRTDSVGRALMENLSSFDGEVIPVHPDRETVLGRPAYSSIGAVPDAGTIDLAVVAVPAASVVAVTEEIGDAGISNVVVVSAGFGEAGPEGAQRERELIAVAEAYDLTLIGPNCVGVSSTRTGLNATFVEGAPTEGSISLVSESGAIIAAILGWASQHGLGFRDIVSLGNEAVLDETDLIDAWGDDPETEVILAYLEDIDDGRRFIETAREVTTETPIVALKSGRTPAGAEAAASHTGSIAGSEEAYRAGFHQAGVIRATTIQELFDIGRVLAEAPPLNRDDIAVITNGGGPGVLATDALGDSHLQVATFGEALQERLRTVVPPAADVDNPLDIIGDADIDRFRQSLDAVLGAEEIGGVIVVSVPTGVFEFEALAEVISTLQQRHETPVVTCLMGGDEADQAATHLTAAGIPNYFDPSRAVHSLEALATQRTISTRQSTSPTRFDVDQERAQRILRMATENGERHLSVEAMDLLDACGIPIPDGGLAERAAEAEAIARELGGSVVMKIVSPDILHKSDIGGVEVGVAPDAVAETYQQLVDRATNHNPDATVLGVQVEEMIAPEDATETLVGARRDPQFGPLVTFGLGGIFVQVFEDAAFRVAPLSEREARAMTAEIQAAPMLRGARGRAPADLDAVVETLQRVSQLVTDFPAIKELDINPLVVGPKGVYAVDLRARVETDTL